MTQALNDTTGTTAKFLNALNQTMVQQSTSLESLIGSITKDHARALLYNMAANGLAPTDREYERLCGEIFKRWP